MTWDQSCRFALALAIGIVFSSGAIGSAAQSVGFEDVLTRMSVPRVIDGAWVLPGREAGSSRRAASGSYEQAAYDACARYGCDGSWLYATLLCESGGDPNAVGLHGEIGIMQFMPSTAYAYGPIDPWDPYASIDLAAEMFSEGLSYHWLCA